MQRRQNLQQIIARSEAELYALQHFPAFQGEDFLIWLLAEGKR